MAALISDLWNVSKKYIQRELKNPDVNNNQFISIIIRMIWKLYESEQNIHMNI